MARIVLILLCLSAAATAQDAAWPGGVAKIDLGAASGAAPIVKYDEKRVLVAKTDGRWQAVIGVNLEAAVGSASITVAEGSQRSFEISSHAYREQHLEVAPGYVALSEENLARVGGERKIIDAALNNWRAAELDVVSLRQPVA